MGWISVRNNLIVIEMFVPPLFFWIRSLIKALGIDLDFKGGGGKRFIAKKHAQENFDHARYPALGRGQFDKMPTRKISMQL